MGILKIFRSEIWKSLVFITLTSVFFVQAHSETLVIADFEATQCTQKKDFYVYNYGAFYPSTNGWASESCVGDPKTAGKGRTIRLEYNVAQSTTAFAGFWLQIRNLDPKGFSDVNQRLSHEGFRALKIDILGDENSGFSIRIKVEIKIRGLGWYYTYIPNPEQNIPGIAGRWQTIEIPLNAFTLMRRGWPLPEENVPSEVQAEFVFCFENREATVKKGAVYFDNIGFAPKYPTLGEALDNLELTWTTGGNAKWFPQTTIYYYDGDAAQSGTISHDQETWLQATIPGPGILAFYWKVSSEVGYDFLEFYIDGVRQDRISGNVGWQQKKYIIGSGLHTVKWIYKKDGSVNSGVDCGWLDKVEFTRARTLSMTTFSNCEKISPVLDWGAFYTPGESAASETCLTDPRDPAGKGQVMKIEYDVSRRGSYSGFWMKFRIQDLKPSEWRAISFWIRGDTVSGFTTRLKVELKVNEEGWGWRIFYIEGITSEWQNVAIPLTSFEKLGDWHKTDEFVITFEYDKTTVKRGVIYIDDIALLNYDAEMNSSQKIAPPPSSPGAPADELPSPPVPTFP
ncbi:MAG: carbohydrate binding domain-containing protein [Thermoproteota archaeon]